MISRRLDSPAKRNSQQSTAQGYPHEQKEDKMVWQATRRR